jgi:hypothetical protein
MDEGTVRNTIQSEIVRGDRRCARNGVRKDAEDAYGCTFEMSVINSAHTGSAKDDTHQ